MATAANIAELGDVKDAVREIYRETIDGLMDTGLTEMAIHRRISRTTYAHRCIEGSAVKAYRERGIDVAPGMKISYIVVDAGRYRVVPEWCAEGFDARYYRELVDKAWAEVSYAFDTKTGGDRAGPDQMLPA
ncbi:MAG: hypothetical protein ABFC71_00010 [Methanoregula sp.]